MFSYEYCGIFKITIFEDPSANGCFYQMLFQHDQFKAIWLLHNLHLKFLFHNENIKIISKIVNRKNKTKKIYNSLLTYNVYVMFYYKIPWFYQDFKSENLCFF